MHGWVFVAGHESGRPHFLEELIRRESERVLGADYVTLEMDHTVNIWNTPSYMHGKFDAVWLPDLGLHRSIATGDITGKTYPLPDDTAPIDWQYLFNEKNTMMKRADGFWKNYLSYYCHGATYF